MKIAVSGASGFIGSHLSEFLKGKGHQVVPLSRRAFLNQERLCSLLEGCQVVINLAGAPINHRWSEAYKQTLYDSRIGVTHTITDALHYLSQPPDLFISASAVGYYADSGCYDEEHQRKGSGFLADLCDRWEEEARLAPPTVRTVITRFGVVLSEAGGAFPVMARSARFGIATTLGRGDQYLSWIDLRDLLRAMEWIIEHPTIQGVVNCVAPDALTNRDFTAALYRHYRASLLVTIPAPLLHLLMGEAATFVLKGQCVAPSLLLRQGFVFHTPSMARFLADLPSF